MSLCPECKQNAPQDQWCSGKCPNCGCDVKTDNSLDQKKVKPIIIPNLSLMINPAINLLYPKSTNCNAQKRSQKNRG